MSMIMQPDRFVRINDVTITEKGDRRIAIALLSQNVVLMIQYFILFGLGIVGTNVGNSVQLGSKVIVGLTFIIALPTVLKRSFLTLYLTYLVAGLVFIFEFLFFYNNEMYVISLLFDFFCICLPSFIYAYSLKDKEVMSRLMIRFSHITLGIGTLISYLVLFRRLNIGEYSMTLSYYLLLPSLVFLNKYLTNYAVKYLLLFVLSTAEITLLGSRGALLSIGLYVILWLLVNLKSIYKKFNVKKLVFNFTLLTGITFFVVFFREITRYTYYKLILMGIYSRTLSLFINDQIYMSGRDTDLYSVAVDIIRKNPLLGTGIASDRLYLGNYVHNLFLELAMDFGLILGLVIGLAIIGLAIKTIFLAEIRTAYFILIFFCLGVVPLMVSSSYLVSSWFWIYLGLAISVKSTQLEAADEKDRTDYYGDHHNI